MNKFEKVFDTIARWTITVIVVGVILIIIVGPFCSSYDEYKFKYNISAVYMHEVGRYSVVPANRGNINPEKMPPYAPVDIVADAKENMWVECDYRHDVWASHNEGGCTIHVFDVNSVEGAGWDHGKFGNGKTIKVH